ncbi:hypothetical protein BDU57DRAFT_435527 [Ampelomyces quisqualis]|uniref:Uncharacterized protein n=1 Tax=Ampelomyces quisqualis TaxID=50730 RepID=A0A6A5R2Z1_AMPQU|nr:hypothetical protein BDU57DRAFT_435527 [Ampelomyces quisqualis]
MSFLRCGALRASSLARSSRLIRSAGRQPWQTAVQRRTYASGHGAHGASLASEIPWMVGALAGTAGGLYFVLNQDLGHRAGHDKDDHAETHAKNEGQDDSGDDDSQGDSTDVGKDVAKSKPAEDGDDEQPEDAGKPGAGKPDKKKSGDASGDEPKNDEPGEASPDKSDKPDARGKPKSFNETSGKQEGLSNADTHHSSQISKQDDKSKKGEGVAETAKLKGTVSPDRPGAENKEQRGKAQMDKDA